MEVRPLDQMLTVAEAARIARRSQRTIRRAYRGGSLRAYRDGNGRGVRISGADLRKWMVASVAVRAAEAEPERPKPGVRHRKQPRPSGPSENLRLLNAARQLREPRPSSSGAPAHRSP